MKFPGGQSIISAIVIKSVIGFCLRCSIRRAECVTGLNQTTLILFFSAFCSLSDNQIRWENTMNSRIRMKFHNFIWLTIEQCGWFFLFKSMGCSFEFYGNHERNPCCQQGKRVIWINGTSLIWPNVKNEIRKFL